MLIKQIFVTIGILKILVLSTKSISAILIILLLFMLKKNAYRIHYWYMSKDDAINIMNDSNLTDKRGVL